MILAVSTSVVGAAGVVVGVLLTSLTQVWRDSRQAKRKEQRDSDRNARELTLAVRLVVEELTEAEGLIREAVKAGHYWAADRSPSNALWLEHRPVLATYVPGPADWLGITPAFPELNRLNQLVHERRGQSGDGEKVPVLPDDDTFAAWYHIHRAIWGLEATIDMAEDVKGWSDRIDQMKQVYWGGDP
jgi:hypothetical protein